MLTKIIYLEKEAKTEVEVSYSKSLVEMKY